MIVIDASALVDILLARPTSERLRQRLFAMGESIHALHLLDLEVTQVLLRYARGGEMNAIRAAKALEILQWLPLQRYAHEQFLARIWELRTALPRMMPLTSPWPKRWTPHC